jgi:outer membrane murein-binding lipoprotein Lpp
MDGRMEAGPVNVKRSQGAHWAALALLLVAGCKSSQKYDLIEAELREKDRELAAARMELEYYRGMGRAMQSSRSERPGGVPMIPLKEIALIGGTGGGETDGLPGDDVLEVVLAPRDSDGSSVKVPGKVTIFAEEIQSNGMKNPIGRWDVAPEELRRHWRCGLVTTGYVLVLQWDKTPTTEKLRVRAQFTGLDGRMYEAEKDVGVRPKAPLSDAPCRPAVILGPATAFVE